MLGHTGLTTTALSPASMIDWQHSRIDCMPELVTVMRSALQSLP